MDNSNDTLIDRAVKKIRDSLYGNNSIQSNQSSVSQSAPQTQQQPPASNNDIHHSGLEQENEYTSVNWPFWVSKGMRRAHYYYPPDDPFFPQPGDDPEDFKYKILRKIGYDYARYPSDANVPVNANQVQQTVDPSQVHTDTDYKGGIFTPTYNMQGTPSPADTWANRSNVPTPPTRPTSGPAAASQPGFFSRLFSGDNYQSNNQLVAPKGSKNPTEINWGNSDSNADFFRASQALQKMDPNYVANNADDTFDNGHKRGGAVKEKKHDPLHHALSLISHILGHKHQ
jgi:hypothetical protein